MTELQYESLDNNWQNNPIAKTILTRLCKTKDISKQAFRLVSNTIGRATKGQQDCFADEIIRLRAYIELRNSDIRKLLTAKFVKITNTQYGDTDWDDVNLSQITDANKEEKPLSTQVGVNIYSVLVDSNFYGGILDTNIRKITITYKIKNGNHHQSDSIKRLFQSDLIKEENSWDEWDTFVKNYYFEESPYKTLYKLKEGKTLTDNDKQVMTPLLNNKSLITIPKSISSKITTINQVLTDKTEYQKIKYINDFLMSMVFIDKKQTYKQSYVQLFKFAKTNEYVKTLLINNTTHTDTLIEYAIIADQNNDATSINTILKIITDIPARNKLLVKSVMENANTIVNQLLNNFNEDINIRWFNEGNTLLHYAAKYGNVEAVNLILGKPNININIQNGKKDVMNGDTPLHLALINKHFEVVDILLRQESIDVNIDSQYTEFKYADDKEYPGTPLLCAINMLKKLEYYDVPRALKCINSLISDEKININTDLGEKNTILHKLAEINYNIRSNSINQYIGDIQKQYNELLDTLFTKDKLEINSKNDDGNTPLFTAVRYSNVPLVTKLLDKNADKKISGKYENDIYTLEELIIKLSSSTARADWYDINKIRTCRNDIKRLLFPQSAGTLAKNRISRKRARRPIHKTRKPRKKYTRRSYRKKR